MFVSELAEKLTNDELFNELIHDLNKTSYLFDQKKLKYSELELIRKIFQKYLKAMIIKNSLNYSFSSQLIKYIKKWN